MDMTLILAVILVALIVVVLFQVIAIVVDIIVFGKYMIPFKQKYGWIGNVKEAGFMLNKSAYGILDVSHKDASSWGKMYQRCYFFLPKKYKEKGSEKVNYNLSELDLRYSLETRKIKAKESKKGLERFEIKSGI